MVLLYLIRRNRIFEFPFWAGVISMGWFFPQAIGGLAADKYPEGAYASGMLFASICTMALWVGYVQATKKRDPGSGGWLDSRFKIRWVFYAGALLCLAGFYFEWKLNSLPEEMLKATQWTGATVKYHFLASVFKFGFLALWLLYLEERKTANVRLLIFLVPSLLLLLEAAVINGRREAMMNIVAYLLICPWFVRRISIPRWMLVVGLLLGLVLINSIGLYRGIMKQKDLPLSERLKAALQADYTQESKETMKNSGKEFDNYIFYRQVYAEDGGYNYGLKHWNGLVFNYVPAQWVGRGTKDALMISIQDNTIETARQRYGHTLGVGTTLPGYTDAFGSFWWLGFIKFYIIGWMMGGLYRHAMNGSFFAQLLYVYALGDAMRGITHGTHAILCGIWVYFFALAFPVFYMGREK
ncbi:MAG: hypothetical protein JXR25_03755 [Pontiellaceae bacterium]|nr:hypothetical protein [Pontiellaceae bacterium]